MVDQEIKLHQEMYQSEGAGLPSSCLSELRSGDIPKSDTEEFLTLIEGLPALVALLGPDYTIRFANRRVRELFQPSAEGRCYELLRSRKEPCEQCPVAVVFRTGRPAEGIWNTSAGREYRICAFPFVTAGGSSLVLKIGLEITEQKRMERELKLERNKLKGILDAMQDGVCIVSQQKEVEYINPALEKELGAVAGRKCYKYFYNADAVCSPCRAQEVFAGKSVRYERHIGGKSYDVFDTPFLNANGVLSKLGIIHDVTEDKRIEKALRDSERKLRSLSFELLAAQETERRRISRELHDGLGQSLTVLKLRLGFIKRSLQPEQGDISSECEQTLRYIDQVIENARRMSRDLSPSILEDLGLTAALRRLAEEYMKLHETNFVVELDRIDDLFSEKARIVLYRIVQEALTNIERHAQARKVSLSIRREPAGVAFDIEDDGKGFDVASALAAEKGLGLATINERVRMLGGSLRLWSRPGSGTRVSFSIPVQEGKK